MLCSPGTIGQARSRFHPKFKSRVLRSLCSYYIYSAPQVAKQFTNLLSFRRGHKTVSFRTTAGKTFQRLRFRCANEIDLCRHSNHDSAWCIAPGAGDTGSSQAERLNEYFMKLDDRTLLFLSTFWSWLFHY